MEPRIYGFDDSYQLGCWLDECDDLPITRHELEVLGIDMSPLDEYDDLPASWQPGTLARRSAGARGGKRGRPWVLPLLAGLLVAWVWGWR